jgi:hypothetical protein
MRLIPSLAVSLILSLATTVRATVSFDLAVDRLSDGSGAAVPAGALVLLVADTNGDGLGTAYSGGIGLQAALDGDQGDDLVVYRSDLSGMGTGGVLGSSTGGLELGGVGPGQWSAGDPLYLVWFPNLTLASGYLAPGQPYGALAVGLTPPDGGNDLLVYVAPTNSGVFGNLPSPSGAVDPLSTLIAVQRDALPPSVNAPTSGAITGTGAILGGTVVADNGDPVVQRGVVYAVVSGGPEPALGGPGALVATSGGGVGAFTTAVSGLTGGTTYAFRAFATNGGGTGYSAVAAFTTDATLTLVGGLASVTRDLLPGDRHRFRFTIDRPRYLFLTTGGVPVVARLYNGAGQLIAEQATEGAVSFANLLVQTGEYTLDLSRGAAPGGAVPYTLSIDASNTVAPMPDASVGTSLTSQTGTNLYFPTVQQLTLASPDGRAVTGYVSLTNRGNVTDRFALRGTPGNADFAVGYFDAAGANVTAGVTVGSFLTAPAAPAAAAGWIRAVVTPSRRAVLLRQNRVFSIEGISQFEPLIKDAVSIRVNTR